MAINMVYKNKMIDAVDVFIGRIEDESGVEMLLEASGLGDVVITVDISHLPESSKESLMDRIFRDLMVSGMVDLAQVISEEEDEVLGN